MARQLNLMVLPGTTRGDVLPQILVDVNSVWMGGLAPSVGASPQEMVNEFRTLFEQAVSRQLKQEELGGIPGGLKLESERLYEQLVPQMVRDQIAGAAGSSSADDPPVLQVHSFPGGDWIPWEALYDGHDFLGLRFQVARMPIVTTLPRWDHANGHVFNVGLVYNLLGNDVLDEETLEEEFNLWQATFDGLLRPNARETRFPPAAKSEKRDYPSLTHLMAAVDADLLHITCHGTVRGQQNESIWVLGSSDPLEYHISAGAVKTLRFQHRPLVFGNACTSSVADQMRNGILAPGFGHLFFENGASNFVGTFAPITKNLAVRFARRFYEFLLKQQMPIGKALWQTKKHFAADPDVTWLFYCLYGLPQTSFQLVGPSQTSTAGSVGP